MTDSDKILDSILEKLVAGEDLITGEVIDFVDQVVKGHVSNVKIAAILTALRIKGETSKEITAFAMAFHRHDKPFPLDDITEKWDYPFIDTCGTGGDGKGTFNVSTVSAFVVAGHGVPVLKHGNRSVSSSCGSSDLLTELGVKIDCTPEQARGCLEASNFAFLFAPLYHPAMKKVANVRKELGIRTIFNFLGPMLHPARIQHQLIGVFSQNVQRLMAETLEDLGVKRFMVVHSYDGMDEVSIFHGTNVFSNISNISNVLPCNGKLGNLYHGSISPILLGFKYNETHRKEITATTLSDSVALAKDVLSGKKGPARDIVLLNAACSLVIVGAAKNLEEGIKMAAASIDEKKASGVLDKMVQFFEKNC